MPVTINKKELCQVISGTPVDPSGESILAIGLEFDSREIKGGEIFIALPGEVTHGHAFLPQAAQKGTALFIVESAEVAKDLPDQSRVVVVKSSQQALYDLASWWRKSLNLPTVAVTGSVGKTTTKEIIRTVLQECGKGTWALKSHNNHVGVPYTILRSNKQDEWLVLEVGMNHVGEISTLSKCACPDVAVITTVAPAHIEYLGSIEAIAKEKLSIADGLAPGEGKLIVNNDCEPLVSELSKMKCDLSVASFGRGCEAEVGNVVANVVDGQFSIEFDLKLYAEIARVTLKIPGRHNAMNVAAAVLAVKALYPLMSVEEMAVGLSKFSPPEMRLQSFTLGDGRTVIDDSYNANPESMHSLFEIVKDLVASGKKVGLVLGEMRELGGFSEKYHVEVGEGAAESGASFVTFVGDVAKWYKAGVKNKSVTVLTAQTQEEAAEITKKQQFDIVLVKASRGAKLEKTVKALVG